MNYIKVKDVTDFVRNGANIKQDKQCTSGIPITRIETISNSQFNWNKFGYANITDDKYKEYYLKDKDVLLSHINSAKFLGRSVLFEQKNTHPIIHGMNLLCLRFRQEEYMPSFFVWYSKSQIANNYFAENTKKAVNQASITSSAIKEMPIPDITLGNQQKIAAELDTIQSAIDNKKQQLSLLDEAVKSEFVEMFGDPVLDTGNPFSECFELNPKKTEKQNWSDDLEISFLPMSCVSECGDVDTSIIKHYSEVKKGFTYFRDNDVLFAKITPCMENGKGGIATKLRNGIGFGSTEFHVLRPINLISNSYWIYYLTTFKSFRKYAEKKMTGSAGQKRVPVSFFDNIYVNLPPIDLQNQFAAFVQQIDKSKFVVKQQIADLQELLDSKMQEYFS